jgi:putative transposase
VFIPQYRRKALYGELRTMRGEIFHDLARQKEWRLIEGHLLAEQGPMCLELPPRPAVASVSGVLKGKSALAIARRVQEKGRNFVGDHFWARGYAVSTVGCEVESVKKYLREQEQAEKEGRF